jgi:hypothetical protein
MLFNFRLSKKEKAILKANAEKEARSIGSYIKAKCIYKL